jgi:hypothetical protein
MSRLYTNQNGKHNFAALEAKPAKKLKKAFRISDFAL